jgi:hypothetical protein
MELLVHGTSGALSALAANIFLYPFETIRTRMQALSHSTTLRRFLTGFIEQEGVLGLYKGFKSSLIGTVLGSGIYFLVYRLLQKVYLTNKKVLSLLDHIKVSVISSVITVISTAPIWTVNTRLIQGQGTDTISCFVNILQKEGISGLYKGFGPSLLLCSNPVIHFVIYERLKVFAGNGLPPHAMMYFAFAAYSKLIATIFTYPILTIRTKLQIDEEGKTNIIKIIKEIYSRDGIRGYYTGLASKLMHTILNSAIILAIHEKLTSLILRLLRPKSVVSISVN